ncbi:MAG: TRAP transporter small permease subunit [Azospirillum sp.]|nr:TRAP transporter small permease subunit [Azospirillum sp.]
MRRVLDAVYDAGAILAALFMVLILLNISLQVLGGPFHFYLRGTDAFAGYSMAAASFLALAHTLKRNEHIRVTLLLNRLSGWPRRVLELWCLGVACAISGYFSWFAWKMVWWSWRFHDVSAADDRTPLWLPQIAMALGVSLLAVAFADELVSALTGRAPATSAQNSGEISHSE